MNILQCESWARRLRGVSWYADLRGLGQTLRSARRDTGHLLVVGHPDDEPWHLTAHLDMLAHYRDVPELRAWLIDGPQVAAASRHDTVLVVSERPLPVRLLDQVDQARAHGSAVLGLYVSDPDLGSITSESVRLDLDRLDLGIPGITADFEIATHLFGVAAASPQRHPRSLNPFRRGGAGTPAA